MIDTRLLPLLRVISALLLVRVKRRVAPDVP